MFGCRLCPGVDVLSRSENTPLSGHAVWGITLPPWLSFLPPRRPDVRRAKSARVLHFPAPGAVQNKKTVVMSDQRGAVTHADESDAGFLEQLIQVVLIVFIQRTGGFVEKGKLRLAQEKPSEGNSLLFPEGQHVAPVHHAI